MFQQFGRDAVLLPVHQFGKRKFLFPELVGLDGLKDAKILADAQALAETIANLPLTLALKAEEGKLFGTVTATDLAEALAAKGIELDRKLIAVEGIKTVGEYEATAKLHKEVKAVIKFSVTAAE